MRPAQNPALAATLTIGASALAAGSTLMAKVVGSDTLGNGLHALQVSQGRFIFGFIGISLAVLILRPTFGAINFTHHISRAILGWGGVTLMFAAAVYIPLSDATAISFLNPVFAMLLAIPFLGERVGKWRWIAAAISITGAVILLRPGADSLQLGALLALGAAVVLGAEVIFIKLLTRAHGPLEILMINNAIGLVISSIVAYPFWVMPTMSQWFGLAGVGFLMVGAQAFFTNAMMRADASFVTPFFYATLVFAAIYDTVFFNVLPDGVSILGSATILAGAGLLAWRETVRNQA